MIVTGAGGGIGRAIALELARCGAAVVVNDLGAALDGGGTDAGPAARVVAEIAALGGRAVANTDSVADPASGQRLVACAMDSFGRLDGVVNNAGIVRDRFIHKMSDEEWDAVVKVHLYGGWHVSRAAERRRWASCNAQGQADRWQHGLRAGPHGLDLAIALCIESAHARLRRGARHRCQRRRELDAVGHRRGRHHRGRPRVHSPSRGALGASARWRLAPAHESEQRAPAAARWCRVERSGAAASLQVGRCGHWPVRIQVGPGDAIDVRMCAYRKSAVQTRTAIKAIESEARKKGQRNRAATHQAAGYVIVLTTLQEPSAEAARRRPYQCAAQVGHI